MNIQYRFEELPSFFEGEFRSGAHNGTAEIRCLAGGEWVVTDISLDCHNGKCGAMARGKTIEVSRRDPLFDRLVDALVEFSGDHISDVVNEAMSEPSRMTLQAAE